MTPLEIELVARLITEDPSIFVEGVLHATMVENAGMDDYLVQYATAAGRIYEWTKADNHINAAADVLIDKGFDATFENDLVIVVCKNTWKAGIYFLSDVRQVADGILGLTNFPDDPADSWKN